MLKKFRVVSLLAVIFTLFAQNTNAQVKKGDLIDGIAAVIGNEIVLESDILDQMNYSKQQGTSINNKCEFLGSLVNNKVLIYEAKRDTLIESRADAIKDMAAQKYDQILGQFPDEKTMLKTYNFRTAYEMKSAMEKIDSDNYYGQQKYARITEKADVTPNEVTDFYNLFKYQLPEVKDEVTLSQIMMSPKLTEAHKQELIDKLKRIKADIQNGESFESMARIYSEDPGSAAKGGLYTNIAKGKMVKPFEAAALNLQEGELSDPVESEFGYHLIQLVKKSGKMYDARHILLSAKPNKEEIAVAKKELDDIKTKIEEGKITFKEAAFKYSDDKNTKFNGGTITSQNGGDKIEKLDLTGTLTYQIAGLNKNDITEVFEEEVNNKMTVNIVRVNDIIPAHQLELSSDYERIKDLALNKKKSEMIEKYVKEQLPSIFISINKRYNECDFTEKFDKTK